MGRNQYEKGSQKVSTYRLFFRGNKGFFRNITLIITISVFWEYTRKNVQQERKVRDKIDVEQPATIVAPIDDPMTSDRLQSLMNCS